MQANRSIRGDALAFALTLALSGTGLRAEIVELTASFDTTIYNVNGTEQIKQAGN